MNYRQVPILALFLACGGVSPAFADGSVVVAAGQAEAAVAPRMAKLRLVNLPALDFQLQATVRCAGTAKSLTLSVADTAKTLHGDELADKDPAEAALKVPARQVALAASSHFCVADDPTSADELTVPAFATAHASLRCAIDDRDSAHFASAQLEVRLVCQREADDDQDVSSDR